MDRQARNLTRKTLLWYSQSLNIFRDYLCSESIETTESISPSHLRPFLVHLAERSHNPGCVKNIGAVKAFLTRYAEKDECEAWLTKLSKVKMPRVPEVVLEKVSSPPDEQTQARVTGQWDEAHQAKMALTSPRFARANTR